MKSKEIFMYGLGALITLSFFGLLALLIFQGIPENNKDILNITIGSLISAFTAIVSYFYGSSKGSADKNETISQALSNSSSPITEPKP